jgi:hypothetical protein
LRLARLPPFRSPIPSQPARMGPNRGEMTQGDEGTERG